MSFMRTKLVYTVSNTKESCKQSRETATEICLMICRLNKINNQNPGLNPLGEGTPVN